MGPRNKNAKIASDPKNQKKLIGKSIKYIASGSALRYICPVCNRSFKRGFFVEEGDKMLALGVVYLLWFPRKPNK